VTLSIETSVVNGRETVLTLRGEVDYETAQDLRTAISEALRREGVQVIAVNLARVTFLDSTGIGTLVVAGRICSELGVAVHVRDANPFIRRLFTVVGVAGALGIDEMAAPVAKPTNGHALPQKDPAYSRSI